MCLIGLRFDGNGELLIAANRDEFADRPTQPMHWWEEGVLAGKDLRADGTWLGITRDGRFAAVTNVRDPSMKDNAVPLGSRGRIVSRFLQDSASPKDVVAQLTQDITAPSPFNLLLGVIREDGPEIWWFGGRVRRVEQLQPGYHTLSNAELNTPWPKSRALHQALHSVTPETAIDGLSTIMRTKQEASEHELPATGVPLEWEKRLSAIQITGESYHTRSTTIIAIHHHRVAAREITWTPDGEIAQQVEFNFQLAIAG